MTSALLSLGSFELESNGVCEGDDDDDDDDGNVVDDEEIVSDDLSISALVVAAANRSVVPRYMSHSSS